MQEGENTTLVHGAEFLPAAYAKGSIYAFLHCFSLYLLWCLVHKHHLLLLYIIEGFHVSQGFSPRTHVRPCRSLIALSGLQGRLKTSHHQSQQD